MPTPEELKKIARDYAEEYSPKGHIDAILREKAIELNSNIFADFLQYLSKDFCIVPKSKLREWQGIVEDALKADPVITEPAFRFMWERLFGTELFNEEKE